MFSTDMIITWLMVFAFFLGVYLWLRHRVHQFDRKYGKD